MDKISWTHDIRAPEIENTLLEQERFRYQAEKIDQAFFVGGFSLQRKVIESATGLSADFSLTCHESIFVNLIDQVYGKVPVRCPKTFNTYPIYLDDKKYPSKVFLEGTAEMDGTTALQFIKAVPVNDQDPVIEHNRRKDLVLKAAKYQTNHLFTYLKILDLLRKKFNDQTIEADFDLGLLLRDYFDIGLIGQLSINLFDPEKFKQIIPADGKEIYICDYAHGDGGVQWVAANSYNPHTETDLRVGLYGTDQSYEIPSTRDKFIANTYAHDLVSYYWWPMRQKVKSLLQGS